MEERASGVLCHISSLYSEFGIGDLGKSAYDFVDFLVLAKQSIWQILPVNPTSFGDSPYQSFSTFAGNPLFICPQTLLEWDLLAPKDLLHDINFPENKIDYAEVISLKERIFRKAYANFKNSPFARAFKIFVEENADWLVDYSRFLALKSHFIAARKHLPLPKGEVADYYYGAVWSTWPEVLPEADADEVGYHNFLQFIFYKQYAALKAYANKKGIKIAGDIPIFAAYDSADCWANRKLFKLDAKGRPIAVAGVPPDYFAKDGQLWGNPLYDWRAHKAEGYKWWIARISKALEVFDILRLDHFRGFESYWTVPYGAKTAKLGAWQPGPGREFFGALKGALGELPIVAEDLGIITPAVAKLLKELNLPGMKVLQFAFDNTKNNTHMPHNFDTNNIVVYTGTHDNDTTLGWYATAPEKSRDQFRRYLNVSGENAPHDLIRAALLSIAKIAIIPVQDLLSLDSVHRTNTPGEAAGNWQFRLKKGQIRESHAENLAYLTELSCRA
jgi:4-alpha-glucanotransferase